MNRVQPAAAALRAGAGLLFGCASIVLAMALRASGADPAAVPPAPAPPSQPRSQPQPAAEPHHTFVVLGDSLAAGYGVDPAEAFPALLQKLLNASGLDFKVVNAGVSGDTSAGALRRLDWILRRPLDVLLVEVGGNDGLRGQPVAALKNNLQSIVARTRNRYPHARIVLAGMRMPANMGTYAEQYDKVFGDVAREERIALIPFLLAGVGGVPEMNQPDGIHPTPEGHRRIATNVFTVLKPILEKAAALPASSDERGQ